MSEYAVTRTTLKRSELREKLLPKLRKKKKVFHVTTQEAWPSIEESGRVLVCPPDCSTLWPNAGLRSLRYVSLCDLRSLEEKDVQHGLDKYYFLDPRPSSQGPVFLFLRESAIDGICTYPQLVDKVNNDGKLIAPYIEAGYPGDLSLEKIGEVLVVDVLRSPTSPVISV